MSPTYQQNKEHIYKWVANNKTKYNEGTAKRMVKYRLKQKAWKEIKTEFLKRMPPHQAIYGHDWHLIDSMMRTGAKYKYVDDEPTYTVMNFPHDQEEID